MTDNQNSTMTLNIKDAFSDQVYPNVEFQSAWTVREAIRGLSDELGLPLVDENMNERAFALKKTTSDTRLQNDQVLSAVAEEGETLEFYEESTAGIDGKHGTLARLV